MGNIFFVICIINSHLSKTDCWFIIMCLRNTVSCKTIQQRSYLKSNTWVMCLYDKISWKWLMEPWRWLVKMNTANNCFKDMQKIPKYFNVSESRYTDVLSVYVWVVSLDIKLKSTEIRVDNEANFTVLN